MPTKGIETETNPVDVAQQEPSKHKAAPEEKASKKARFETQTVLFDLTEEQHAAVLAEMSQKLNRKRARAELKDEEVEAFKKKTVPVRRAYNLMSRNSDTHMLAINLEKPQIRQLSSKFNGKRITEHWGHKTPSGLEFDTVEYHADGGDKSDKRLKEHALLAENHMEWLAEQKAKLPGNASRDKLIAFDCNISVATFNVKKQQEDLKNGIKHPREHYLTWNKDYIKFLETAFPGGIYRIAMPSEVMFKPRGVADAQGDFVANFGNNQADKEGVPVYAAKPGIIHVKTDADGNPISEYNPQDLLKQPIQFKIVDFKDSKTLEDHPSVRYIFNEEVAVTCGGNMAVTGFKAWNDPRKSFKSSALNDKGGMKLETVHKNQFCMTELGKCLNGWLGLGITEADLQITKPERTPDDRDDRPQIKATSDFTKLFRDRFKEKVQKELAIKAAGEVLGLKETVAYQLKAAMTEWMFSQEYIKSADDLKSEKQSNLVKNYGKDTPSDAWLVDLEAVDKFIAESNKKGEFEDFNFKEFIRLFNVEWSGGFWLENSDVVDNKGVDKRQSKAAVERLADSLAGEHSTLVFGGDGKDQNTSKVQAALEIRTESYLAPKVACRTLPQNEAFQQFKSPVDWVKNQLANDKTADEEFLWRFENEIYYANKVGDGEVIHITKGNCDPELYKKLISAFDDAEKKEAGKVFTLDAAKNSKIYEMLNETFGILLNTSKGEDYHSGVEENAGIPKGTAKRVQMLGIFRAPLPQTEVSVEDATSTLTVVS